MMKRSHSGLATETDGGGNARVGDGAAVETALVGVGVLSISNLWRAQPDGRFAQSIHWRFPISPLAKYVGCVA